jgi:D-3-phosphoglycerate dehydrogenase
MLVFSNRDVPGVIGRIGTFLGQKGVNIVDFALARGSGGRAAAVVRVDPPPGGVGPDLVSALAHLEGIESARLVTVG